MTLLNDFKTEIGATGNTQNQYFIDNFLRGGLDVLSRLSANIKVTTVPLVAGTQTYNLASVGTPAVGASGIYKIMLDGEYNFPYIYKREVVLSTPTTLFFPSSDTVTSGELTIKYKAYYSSPTWVDPTYTETDAPGNKIKFVKQWAVADYKLSQIGGNNSNLITSKGEDNLRVGYGGLSEQIQALTNQKIAAEVGMRDGAQADFKFFNIQII